MRIYDEGRKRHDIIRVWARSPRYPAEPISGSEPEAVTLFIPHTSRHSDRREESPGEAECKPAGRSKPPAHNEPSCRVQSRDRQTPSASRGPHISPYTHPSSRAGETSAARRIRVEGSLKPPANVSAIPGRLHRDMESRATQSLVEPALPARGFVRRTGPCGQFLSASAPGMHGGRPPAAAARDNSTKDRPANQAEFVRNPNSATHVRYPGYEPQVDPKHPRPIITCACVNEHDHDRIGRA